MDAGNGRMSEERQLALLVASAGDYAIFLLDPEGCVRTWNPGAERMNGYTRDEIVGTHFSAFYTEEDIARDHPADALRIALRDGRYEEEGWRVRKDGARFWANVVITPIRDETGALIGFGKVSRDLTAGRLVEEQTRARALELEAANRRLSEYQRLVSSVRDYAIFMLDTGGHIMSWNAGAQQLKGWTPEEIIGRHFSIFYTREDRARNHPANELEIAVRDGRYEEEGWRVRKDGTTFWASVTITALRDDDGRLTGFAKVTRDLTERRRAEQELRRTNEELRALNEELDRFSTVAAHDMTDPLRTISGFAELLERTDPPPDRVREYAGHVHATSARLTDMLQGLLTYARAGKNDAPPVPVDLCATIGQVLAELRAPIVARGADVAVTVPEGAVVLAEPHDVQTLVQNLLSNAVKFADPDQPAITIGGVAAGDCWRVMVEDNGPGVAADDRDRIFRAFERAGTSIDRAGYGLGLAICQRLVDRHGGRLGVDTEEGRGACFWFTLPASTDRPPLPAPPSAPPAARTRSPA